MDEASERVQDLERRNGLFRFVLDGWCSWPVFRFDAIRALEHLPADTRLAKVAARSARWQRLRDTTRDLSRLFINRRADVLVKTYASARGEVVGGRTKDVFFDDLLARIGPGFKVEAQNSRVETPALIPANLSTAALGVLSERLARRYPITGARDHAVALSDILRAQLGLERSADHMARSLSEFVWLRRLYERLLGVVQPRCVLTADPEIALVAAAKNRGIPVVEIQHGFVSRTHEAYSWPADAVPFKSLLPIPDAFLTQGPYWTEELASGGFWGAELRTVGNVRLDSYRARPRDSGGATCNVLLSTQGVDTSNLIAFMRSALKQVEGRFDYQLHVKMHPVYDLHEEEWRRAFSDFSSVTIATSLSGPSTFELLSQSDVHLSIFSSVHYEALGLGVPTVVLPLYGHEIVRHLWQAAHARVVANPTELAELLSDWRELKVPIPVSERYFTPGALESTVTEIAGMMNRPPGAARPS